MVGCASSLNGDLNMSTVIFWTWVWAIVLAVTGLWYIALPLSFVAIAMEYTE